MNNGSKEAKDHQESVLRRLVEIMQRPENAECMDCTSPNPSWASINIGIFVCIRCSGLHRQLGVQVSRVKSCTMDLWEEEQVEMMDKMGNRRAKLIYEGTMPASYMKPGPRAATSLMLQLIMDKYKHRKYYRAPESIPKAVLDGVADPKKADHRGNKYTVTVTYKQDNNGRHDSVKYNCYLDEKKKQSVMNWLHGTTIVPVTEKNNSNPSLITTVTTTTTTTTTTTNSTTNTTKNNTTANRGNASGDNNSARVAKTRLAARESATPLPTARRPSYVSTAPSTPMERMSAPSEEQYALHGGCRPSPAPPSGPRPSFHRDPNEYTKAPEPAFVTFTPQRVAVPSSQTNRRGTELEEDLYTYRSTNASFSCLIPTRDNSLARAPSWLRSSPVMAPKNQQAAVSPMASWQHADTVLSERCRAPSLHLSESAPEVGPSVPELQGSESRAHFREPPLLQPARAQEGQGQGRTARSPSVPLFSPSFE